MSDFGSSNDKAREASIINELLGEYEDKSSQYLGSSNELLNSSTRVLDRSEMFDIFKECSKHYASLKVIEPSLPIKLAVLHIAPTTARDILEFSRRGAINKEHSNRRVKQRSVKQYIDLMNEGRWCLNGEAIIFDADGELLDGHTRLEAAARSNSGFITVVIWGIADTKAFANTNVGDIRSRSNVLEMAGVKKVNAQVLSQVASLAKAFESAVNPYAFRGTQGTAFRGDEILAYVKKHEELALSVDLVSKLAKTHKQSQASEATYAFAHYLIKQNIKELKIDDMGITPELYITNVMSGLGQTSVDSIEYKVREFIQTTVGEGSSYALLCRLSCIFKGWNLHMGIPVIRNRVAVTRVGKFFKDENGTVIKTKAAGNIKEAFTIPCKPPGKTPRKIKRAAAMKAAN